MRSGLIAIQPEKAVSAVFVACVAVALVMCGGRPIRAANFTSDDVFVASDKTAEGQIYRINGSTGAVSTFVSNYTAGDIVFFQGSLLAWNNSNGNVDRFDANGNSSVFITQSQIGDIGPEQLTYDSLGQFYFAGYYGALSILSTPGAVAARTPVYASSMILSGVAVDDSGNAFIRGFTNNYSTDAIYKVTAAQLAGADYSVDLTYETPFLQAGGITGHSGLSQKLTFHDGYLYVGSSPDGTTQTDWFRVDPVTGGYSLYATSGGSIEIDFSSIGQAYSVTWAEPSTPGGTLFRTTSPGSGAFGELAGGLRTPFSVAVAAVPEIGPSGLGSVLALVLGALGVLERRRLKAV